MPEPRTVTLPAPTGTLSRATALPAARPTTLAGARLLLLDNGQVGPSQERYGPLLDWLVEDLAAAGVGVEVDRRHEDLIQFPEAELAGLQAEILAGGYAGLVIAVCHAGVTASSTVLALALERAGFPCVLLCTALGRPLAETMAAHDVPALPLVEVPWLLPLGDDAVAASRRERAKAVVEALTTPAERLVERVSGAGDPVAGLREIAVETADGTDLGAALYDEFEALQIGDGLPVVPPTEERVAAMLAASPLAADEVLIEPPMPSGSSISVRNLAVNAVLAGCLPEYFPVVLAAMRAMAAPEYRFFHTAITTHPGGTAIVVSGPIAEQLGIASGAGCLGPGFRANATIGRAVNLALINLARSIPGRSSLATHGSPAQYSYCFAEQLEGHPWQPLHIERADKSTSTVTVLKCEAPHNVLSMIGTAPEQLLAATASVAATLGANAFRFPGDHLVILNPLDAARMAAAGWTKDDVRHYLFEHARIDRELLPERRYLLSSPTWFEHADRVPVAHGPEEFHVVVAGGIGPQLMIAPPWGLSAAVTRPIETP